jgi:hypothetical protein
MRRLGIAGVLAAVLMGLSPNPARACGAEIEIRFIEASGGDIFIVSNMSQESWAMVELTIRLTGSLGHLWFDTVEGGPGYSMAQPFGAVDNEVGLVAEPDVGDGDVEIRLQFRDFGPGKSFTFVIDVDDRMDLSDFGRAVISGPEIQGATGSATLTQGGGIKSRVQGKFKIDGRALLKGGLCV